MKKVNKIISIVALASMIFSSTAFAHKGRLDSNQGHKDNKNVSGLGSYHYHCNDSPAHLHKNGVCPYANGYSASTSSSSKSTSNSSKSNSSSASSAQSVSTPAPAPTPKIVATNLRTFVNGYEIPTFSHSDLGGAYIIAEDMVNYGFDTSWNDATKTLTIKTNNEKTLIPMDMSYYKQFNAGTKFFDIKDNYIDVVLDNGTYTYHPQSYNCGGYMAISADELKMFGYWLWDNDNQAVNLWTR